MTSFQKYWNKIICINRRARPDRWDHVKAETCLLGINVERFEAHDLANCVFDGKPNGNVACTASHRGVLELICHHQWSRTLVLEDDFHAVNPCEDRHPRKPFHEQWVEIEREIPDEWDLLYLAGHYGSKPQLRISKHIIKVDTMLTTTAYGITTQFARKMAPFIHSGGPIDTLFSKFTADNLCYCVQPRLFVQYPNVSDLQHRFMDNSQCMLDGSHEAMV